MLILLPPSETKRAGGDADPLSLGGLKLPELVAQRSLVIDALVALSADEDTAAKVLKLSERQRGEIATNASVRTAPTMPAMDRYTGVLFDALDAGTLDSAARKWLADHVMIHSAPFGPVGAGDLVPSYRLGAGIRLPGLPSQRSIWSAAVAEALAQTNASFILDLRSEAYVGLGPVPADPTSIFVRVVTQTESGATRALNHFNKHAKGALVRALAQSAPSLSSPADLLLWAAAHQITLVQGETEWQLVTVS